MCRILAARISRPSRDQISRIIGAFVQSNERDPYLERASGGRASSHDDGWGIAAIGVMSEGGGKALAALHHKDVYPIFHERGREVLELLIPRLARYDELFFIVHGRKASRREPYGAEYAHPYIAMFERGAFWFIHNGGADKRALADKLGVLPWLRVDSELLGYYIMNNVIECLQRGNSADECVSSAYILGKPYVANVGSAYNTALLGVIEDTAHLYVSHWVPGSLSPELKEYYKLVYYVLDNGVLVSSITFKDYFGEGSPNELEPGLYKLEERALKKQLSF